MPAAAARRAGALVSSRAVAPRRMARGAAFWNPVRRPHAAAATRRAAAACACHVAAPAACACSATTACACAALACVAVLCPRSVCAAPLSGPACMVAAAARRRHPRLRARPVCRRHVRPCSARPHSATGRPARSRLARRLQSRYRDCCFASNVELADLPCACKRCAYLRPAYGCAVLVQALAHEQLPGAPRALAPCAQPTLAAMLLRYKVRPCPVCASSARACALLSGVLCLCRHSHIDSPRHTSISSTRRFAILVICIHAPAMRWPLPCMHPCAHLVLPSHLPVSRVTHPV